MDRGWSIQGPPRQTDTLHSLLHWSPTWTWTPELHLFDQLCNMFACDIFCTGISHPVPWILLLEVSLPMQNVGSGCLVMHNSPPVLHTKEIRQLTCVNGESNLSNTNMRMSQPELDRQQVFTKIVCTHRTIRKPNVLHIPP